MFLVIVTAFIALLILFDLSPFGGNIRFYSKWAECGQKPVVTNPTPDFGGGSVQDYAEAPTFDLSRMSSHYFCTAFEAEKRGYSADPNSYDFPVLRANNALCKKATDPESETAAKFSVCDDKTK